MKTVFMGTPDFAAVILKKLIEEGFDIVAVVTQPDKEKGRGNKLSFPPVKELALSYGLNIMQPVRVKNAEFIEEMKSIAPDVIVVAAFGQILPGELLNIPRYGCINVHASLLPRYRGASPIQQAIINGDKHTGITIMYMDEKMDTGDIILQESIPIDDEETGGSLHDKLAASGADLLVKALNKIKEGTAERIPQDNSKATYVKLLDKDMGRIDFTMPAVQIERMIRGLNPWPSAYTSYRGKIIKLWRATVEEAGTEAEPGQVIEVRKDALVVMTGENALVIRELQMEGKKRLDAGAFLRGFSILKGSKLGD